MDKFIKKLDSKLKKALEHDFRQTLKEVGEEHIYAAALVLDSDCVSIFMAVSTYENMKEKDEKYVEMLKSSLSDEQLAAVSKGEASFVKWTPDEWGYPDDRKCQLNKVAELLFSEESKNSKEFEENKQLIIDTIISAFKSVIEERILEENSEDIVYFVSMSDDEDIEVLENESAERLNPEWVYEKFLNRYDEIVC